MAEETTADKLAKKHREISVAEFFEKNRHLLGFDNNRKALMTTIKEAVDNALDACEETEVLPEISVEVIDMQNDRFRVIVQDNGPGIIKKQIPKIFAKLLYGSKFHKLSQSRGQQGIGISAAALYGQLTTGRPIRITSKVSPNNPAYYYELHIDTKTNKPEILKEQQKEWKTDHGTRIELDLEGSYQGGSQSIDAYLKQTAIVNPHVTLIYTNPKAEQIIFPRATDKLPVEAKEIKPHPYGVELGRMIKMLKDTESRTLQSFLTNEFCRVGNETAKNICESAALLPNTKPADMTREMAEQLVAGIRKTKLIAPPTDCLSPIKAGLLEKGLKKEVNAEFYTATTRPPAVYRGNPFIVEAAVAYGGNQPADDSVRVLRFANRVPLLYQLGACAITKSVIHTNWRGYGLNQSKGALPVGPCTIVVHIASVWVPFTSESKEAIAHYPEIVKEIKLAVQECGRKLSSYVRKRKRMQAESLKRGYIEIYIPHVGQALQEILGLSATNEQKVEKLLKELLEKKRGKLENMKFDPSLNPEYDANMARIGKDAAKEAEGTDTQKTLSDVQEDSSKDKGKSDKGGEKR
ncbi:DNA topoisomerase VI subunit B [Candidatus Woesearchaeota archaeon]|nr:DNA topoisomerase VI subunit B [Candidatus Woesearchaeota archaeon]